MTMMKYVGGGVAGHWDALVAWQPGGMGPKMMMLIKTLTWLLTSWV